MIHYKQGSSGIHPVVSVEESRVHEIIIIYFKKNPYYYKSNSFFSLLKI